MGEITYLRKSILGGFLISLVAFCYSFNNGSLITMLLFSFGLIAIILYQLPLYTGSAGFIQESLDIYFLFITLIGNALGCLLVAIIITFMGYSEQNDFILNAIQLRSAYDYTDILPILLKAICCGAIMTIAVKFARICRESKNIIHILPLLFGVPLFLLSGFYHSIVDAFYFSYGFINSHIGLIDIEDYICGAFGWLIVVFGNFIGCNIPRLIIGEKDV